MLDEVIPQAVERLGADPRRVAIGGISMGGFGAFDIARRRPRAFCAVGGHSAAIWLRAGDTAPGAFDSAADFRRNDVVGLARARGRRAWGHARLWLDGGTADPFRAADEALAAALGIRMRHWPRRPRRRLLARPLRALPALLRGRARGLLNGRNRNGAAAAGDRGGRGGAEQRQAGGDGERRAEARDERRPGRRGGRER